MRQTAGVVVAVVLLSVALACAVVAIVVLAWGREISGAPTTLAGAGLAPMSASLSAPQSTAENSLVWETLLQPADGGGLSRLSVAPWTGPVPATAGRHLPATAPFARALQELVHSRIRVGSSITTVSEGAGLLFRFDASPDLLSGLSRGLFEVMPAARGGFLSPVRQVGSKQVVGHGAYVPAGGTAVGAGATAAAAPALAPVLLVAGITAALELAAAAEQRRQLEAITAITAAVREEQVRQQIAGLEAAARSLELAAGSILDVGFVPKSLGIDSAADTVGREWQRSSRKLQEWRDALAKLGDSASIDGLAEALPGFFLPDGGEFWRELAIYRLTHALHLRATLLAAAEAAAHNPEHAYPAFQNRLHDHAGVLEEARDSLRAFVNDLASYDIRVGRIVTRGMAHQVLSVTRRLLALSSALTHPVPEADLPAAIGPGGTVELEGVLQAGRLAHAAATRRHGEHRSARAVAAEGPVALEPQSD